MTITKTDTSSRLFLEYEDQQFVLTKDEVFDIGREADLCLDHNPYLHRRFLRISYENDYWWISNIGKGLGVTVYDEATRLQAWLGPSSRLPLVFSEVNVVFSAGPCTYSLTMFNEEPKWKESSIEVDIDGETTVAEIMWTESQRLAILALAEPMLQRKGVGVVHIPSNADVAARLGWQVKKFEKKIDNVCSKLDKLGVDGMRGGVLNHASGRRARLVEWAISTGFVSVRDLALLDESSTADVDD
ncbi:MAG: hypothetical protein FWG15_06915 [Propionibacteriaceae bacterium]|nr:hypothetical protein [Propionibacteriaceae bacterium]